MSLPSDSKAPMRRKRAAREKQNPASLVRTDGADPSPAHGNATAPKDGSPEGAINGDALPLGWRWVTLGDVTESMKNGIYKPSSSYADDGIACLRMYNIGDGKVVWRDIKRMRLSKAEISDYELLPGDLLVNRVNSRELVGKTVAIPDGLERCVFESKNIRVRLRRDLVFPEFASYALLSSGSRYFSQNAQQVVGMASISQPQVARFPLLLPPLDQQRRIVAEIEKQFSRLDEGVASLRRVQANLKRYRASVLKAACEGLFTGCDVLSWEQSTIARSVQIIDYRGRTPPFSDNGIPHFRSQNVKEGRIVRNGLTFITSKSYDSFMTRGIPRDGDVLFTTEAPMGEVAMAPAEKFSVAQRIMILRADQTILDGRFLMLQLRSPDFQARLRRTGTGSTVTGVSSRNFQTITVLIPPLSEQVRIIAEVERRVNVLEGLESVVIANLQRATRMRQALLQKAFNGDLITNDSLVPLVAEGLSDVAASSKPANRHFARALLSAEIVHRLHREPTFGRTKHQKIFHLCEHIARIGEIEGQYHREAAGPLDNKLIYANEGELKKQKWYAEVPREPYGHGYQALPKAGGHQKHLENYWPDKLETVARLIELMRGWNTERCEIFSTIYAAWNDLILLGKEPGDEAILHEVIDCWNDSKKRIPRDRWLKAIEWIKTKGFEPTGFGRVTKRSK